MAHYFWVSLFWAIPVLIFGTLVFKKKLDSFFKPIFLTLVACGVLVLILLFLAPRDRIEEVRQRQRAIMSEYEMDNKIRDSK